MAFESILNAEEELDITVFTGDGETVVRAAIGWDEEASDVYSVVCSLCPVAGDPHCLELTFCVVKNSMLDETDNTDYWDGHLTKGFLKDKETRADVLTVALTAISHLIDIVNPSCVTMMTHEANLPSDALKKYLRILDVFNAHDYEIRVVNEYHGRHMWFMELKCR